MSNIIDMSRFGALPAEMRSLIASNPSLVGGELSAGIMSSMAVMSIRGKVWRVKYRKEEHNLTDQNGDPRPSVEVVILKAAGNLSKIYYPNGYSEDSSEAPTCWSSNSLTPDANVPVEQRQSATCAACPHNVFGSRVTPNGKQAKACTDSKRLAVVPLHDLDNEIYGGPMLLRVPAASLGDIVNYDNKLRAIGFPYMAVGTRIGFDINAEYPKITFNAIRPLNDAEARKVIELMKSPAVARIINESVEVDASEPEAPSAASVFEQPPQVTETSKIPVQTPKAAPKVTPRAEPEVQAKSTKMTITDQIRAASEASEESLKPQPAKQASPTKVITPVVEEVIDETTGEVIEEAPSELDDLLEGLLRS
jgi:hypothetical protein